VLVPAYISAWLADSTQTKPWTIADTGLLVAVLGMFETGRVFMRGGRFETDDEGEMVLVYTDRSSWGWSNPWDDFESNVDVRRSLERLQHNGFITFTHASREFRVRLGGAPRRSAPTRRGRKSPRGVGARAWPPGND
jgi:hypothetical protein